MLHNYNSCIANSVLLKIIKYLDAWYPLNKATPNKFPVSHPPPASVSSQDQKFHYFCILPLRLNIANTGTGKFYNTAFSQIIPWTIIAPNPFKIIME